MRLFLVFFIAVSAILVVSSRRGVKPQSKEMVSFINRRTPLWKAGKSKFDTWSLRAVKNLMGVPLNHIGKESRLAKLSHDVDPDTIPG